MRFNFKQLKNMLASEYLAEAPKKKEKSAEQNGIELFAAQFSCPRHHLPLEVVYQYVKKDPNEPSASEKRELSKLDVIRQQFKGIRPAAIDAPDLVANKARPGGGRRVRWFVCPMYKTEIDPDDTTNIELNMHRKEGEEQKIEAYEIWTSVTKEDGTKGPGKKVIRCDYRVTPRAIFPGQKSKNVAVGEVAHEEGLASPHRYFDKEKGRMTFAYYGDGEKSTGQIPPRSNSFQKIIQQITDKTFEQRLDDSDTPKIEDYATTDEWAEAMDAYRAKKREKNQSLISTELEGPLREAGYGKLIDMINDMKSKKYHWKLVRANEAADIVYSMLDSDPTLRDLVDNGQIKGISIGQGDDEKSAVEIVTSLPASYFKKIKVAGFDINVVKRPSEPKLMLDPTSSTYAADMKERYKHRYDGNWIKVPLEYSGGKPVFSGDDTTYLSFVYPSTLDPDIKIDNNVYRLSKRAGALNADLMSAKKSGASEKTINELTAALADVKEQLAQAVDVKKTYKQVAGRTVKSGYQITASNVTSLMFKLGWDMVSQRPEKPVKLASMPEKDEELSDISRHDVKRREPSGEKKDIIGWLEKLRDEYEELGLDTSFIDERINTARDTAGFDDPGKAWDESDDDLAADKSDDEDLEAELDKLKNQREELDSMDPDEWEFDKEQHKAHVAQQKKDLAARQMKKPVEKPSTTTNTSVTARNRSLEKLLGDIGKKK